MILRSCTNQRLFVKESLLKFISQPKAPFDSAWATSHQWTPKLRRNRFEDINGYVKCGFLLSASRITWLLAKNVWGTTKCVFSKPLYNDWMQDFISNRPKLVKRVLEYYVETILKQVKNSLKIDVWIFFILFLGNTLHFVVVVVVIMTNFGHCENWDSRGVCRSG